MKIKLSTIRKMVKEEVDKVRRPDHDEGDDGSAVYEASEGLNDLKRQINAIYKDRPDSEEGLEWAEIINKVDENSLDDLKYAIRISKEMLIDEDDDDINTGALKKIYKIGDDDDDWGIGSDGELYGF